MLPSLKDAVEAEGDKLAFLRAARTALAIERFRLNQAGDLPETLAQLRPAWLAELPVDPFDGRPIRYRRTEHGYVVYSLGRDGREDGGKEGKSGRSVAFGRDTTFTVER